MGLKFALFPVNSNGQMHSIAAEEPNEETILMVLTVAKQSQFFFKKALKSRLIPSFP